MMMTVLKRERMNVVERLELYQDLDSFMSLLALKYAGVELPEEEEDEEEDEEEGLRAGLQSSKVATFDTGNIR